MFRRTNQTGNFLYGKISPDSNGIKKYGNNGTYAFQGKESGVRPSGTNHIEGEHVGRRASPV